jgi:hypothetical protein
MTGTITKAWRSRAVRRMRFVLLALIAQCCAAPLLLAQASTTPAAPAGKATTVVTASRPLYFEVAIVIVMMGLALFAVCRSSRRN